MGKNSERRCAASDLTIPAASTDLPIMTNTVGSKMPKAAKSHHVGKNTCGLLKSGFNTSMVKVTATM